jgi:hypothetical protein
VEQINRAEPRILDLGGATAALQRAAFRARDEARKADSQVVIVKDGVLQRVSPVNGAATPERSIAPALRQSVKSDENPSETRRAMPDLERAWKTVVQNATRARKQQATLISKSRGSRYQIASAGRKEVAIRRLSSGTDARLRPIDLLNAITRLAAAGGRVRRTEINPIVAKVVALVELAPHLRWSADHEYVLLSRTARSPSRSD